MLTTIISFIVVFGILVIAHELGHFVTAKLSGVKVHEFAVGMGPAIFKKQGKETLYAVRAIPLGGYVKMEGEDGESDDERSFSKVKPWKRLIILSAGAIMNFILAFVLLVVLSFTIGSPSTTIDQTIENLPAVEAGIVSGDKITRINDVAVETWDEITDAIHASNGEKIVIDVERNGETFIYEILPEKGADGSYKVGILPLYEKNMSKIFSNAWGQFKTFFTSIFEFLSRIGDKEVREGVSGPVGIINVIGQASKLGILNIIIVAAYISINLGIFNLLPFPALDGGRIVFVIIEMILGRPIDREKEGYVHFVGIVILLSLTVFLTFRDIAKF